MDSFISQIQDAQTRLDLIRLIIRLRLPQWRYYRNAVILEVAETMPACERFYQCLAMEVSDRLGQEVSIDVCKKVVSK